MVILALNLFIYLNLKELYIKGTIDNVCLFRYLI